MTKSMRIACTEINAILKQYLPAYYSNKLPKDMLQAIENYSLKDYDVKIDKNKSLKEHNFIRDTYAMLASLRVNFWCDSVEEKKKLENMFKANDKAMSQKYDISSINGKAEEKTENLVSSNTKNLPIEYKKKSWFSKVLDKIKKIFNK